VSRILSDADLDALLAILRDDTARVDPRVRRLLAARVAEPPANRIAHAFAMATFASGALVFTALLAPALATWLAAVWWALAVVAGGWATLRAVA